jgi:hypothetical protein
MRAALGWSLAFVSCGFFHTNSREHPKLEGSVMTVIETVRDLLDPLRMSLPPSPPVIGIDTEEYVDADGEPSLRVQVTIDENTDLSQVDGRHVGQLKSAIRGRLLSEGISLFPYIFITKPSELADDGNEEQDAG